MLVHSLCFFSWWNLSSDCCPTLHRKLHWHRTEWSNNNIGLAQQTSTALRFVLSWGQELHSKAPASPGHCSRQQQLPSCLLTGTVSASRDKGTGSIEPHKPSQVPSLKHHCEWGQKHESSTKPKEFFVFPRGENETTEKSSTIKPGFKLFLSSFCHIQRTCLVPASTKLCSCCIKPHWSTLITTQHGPGDILTSQSRKFCLGSTYLVSRLVKYNQYQKLLPFFLCRDFNSSLKKRNSRTVTTKACIRQKPSGRFWCKKRGFSHIFQWSQDGIVPCCTLLSPP